MSRKNRDKPRTFWSDNRAGGSTQPSTPTGDTFHCVVDEVTACSRAPKSRAWIDPQLWYAMIDLCGSCKNEWLGYLIGEQKDDGLHLAELYFPPQTAGGAHVHAETQGDFQAKPGTVAAIHSHVSMQAFFSEVDLKHANWPLEIVLNSRGEYKASMRVTLPCGESMRKDATVVLSTDGRSETIAASLEEAFKVGKEREDVRKPAPSTYTPYTGPSSKFSVCPICYGNPRTCPHSWHVMDEYDRKQAADFHGEGTEANAGAIVPVASVGWPKVRHFRVETNGYTVDAHTGEKLCTFCHELHGQCTHTKQTGSIQHGGSV